VNVVFVSGRPSLDLVGTLKWRRRGDGAQEQLTAPSVLGEWAVRSGLADEMLPVTAVELAEALDLREALYRTVRARLRRRNLDTADVELLNSYAGRRPVTPELSPDGRVRKCASAGELLSSVSRDLLELFGGSEIAHVRECSRAECTRLYVDTSRGRNRRWCEMTECGNRAKVEAFRQRQKPDAADISGREIQ